MRRFIIILSLALGLTAPLVLTAAVAAGPYDPPGDATVAVDSAPCPSSATAKAVVSGGVYQALVSELRQQGYTRAQIAAETAGTLVVSGSGVRLTEAERCLRKP